MIDKFYESKVQTRDQYYELNYMNRPYEWISDK
jgi:hypothetical protein